MRTALAVAANVQQQQQQQKRSMIIVSNKSVHFDSKKCAPRSDEEKSAHYGRLYLLIYTNRSGWKKKHVNPHSVITAGHINLIRNSFMPRFVGIWIRWSYMVMDFVFGGCSNEFSIWFEVFMINTPNRWLWTPILLILNLKFWRSNMGIKTGSCAN